MWDRARQVEQENGRLARCRLPSTSACPRMISAIPRRTNRRPSGARGIEIVQTYAHHGKSGLSIAGRSELQRLISDVRNGNAGFSTILVYDVISSSIDAG